MLRESFLFVALGSGGSPPFFYNNLCFVGSYLVLCLAVGAYIFIRRWDGEVMGRGWGPYSEVRMHLGCGRANLRFNKTRRGETGRWAAPLSFFLFIVVIVLFIHLGKRGMY